MAFIPTSTPPPRPCPFHKGESTEPRVLQAAGALLTLGSRHPAQQPAFGVFVLDLSAGVALPLGARMSIWKRCFAHALSAPWSLLGPAGLVAKGNLNTGRKLNFHKPAKGHADIAPAHPWCV